MYYSFCNRGKAIKATLIKAKKAASADFGLQILQKEQIQ
jgi:hypothetical protein